MRKINSINCGGKIAAVAALFLIAIPLYLYIAGRFMPVPAVFTYISLAIGGLIALFLIVLLAVEFRQDTKQNRFYRAHAHAKLPLGGGRYECQSCGSRDVTQRDTACRTCGVKFEENKTGA